MPKGKKAVHDLYSPKIAQKRRQRRIAAANKKEPEVPQSVDNYKVNKPLFGPHKIKAKGVINQQRKIGPNEGKSIVNAKVADKKLIHKPRPRKPKMDPAAGAIDQALVRKKGKSNVKQTPKKNFS